MHNVLAESWWEDEAEPHQLSVAAEARLSLSLLVRGLRSLMKVTLLDGGGVSGVRGGVGRKG